MASVDRISKLPEAILHRIVSFLTMKEIAQLSVLSKTWKQVSVSQPNLMFDKNFFGLELLDDDDDELQWGTWGKERIYYKMLDGIRKSTHPFKVVDRYLTTFREQSLTINKFELDMWLIRMRTRRINWSFDLDRWLQMAVDNNVREMVFCFQWLECSSPPYLVTPLYTDKYIVPRSVLLATSIVNLTLRNCKLCPTISNYFSFKEIFPSVKKLCLEKVGLSRIYPADLFANLEDLTIKECSDFKSLTICGVNMKKVCLSKNTYLKCLHISSPSLIEAKFDHLNLNIFSLDNCKYLRSITMEEVRLPNPGYWFAEGTDCYPALKNLCLIRTRIQVIKISHGCLNSLEISDCLELDVNEINSPNLSKFTYAGNPIDFSSNASALKYASVELSWPYGYHINAQGPPYLKWIDFLSKLSGCYEMNLTSRYQEDLTIPTDVREQMVLSPLHDVKKLEITIINPYCGPEREFIDTLFWISPHPVVLFTGTIIKHKYKFYEDELSFNEEELRTSLGPLSELKVFTRDDLNGLINELPSSNFIVEDLNLNEYEAIKLRP